MKKIYNIILSAVALLAFVPFAGAQSIEDVLGDLQFPQEKDPLVVDHVGFNKTVSSPTSDGTYWIKLEAFATGEASMVLSSTPADIILVLDSSTSMDTNDYGVVNYVSRGRQPYSYNSYTTTYYCKLFKDGKYYPVYRGGNSDTGYYLYFTADDGTVYYLNDNHHQFPEQDGLATESHVYIYDPGNTFFNGELYERRSSTITRIAALQQAVNEFIDAIYENDQEVKRLDPSYPGNRIAIITYDNNAYTLTSSTQGSGNNRRYVWTENGTANWFYISGNNVRTRLKNSVNNITRHNWTRPDLGMAEAIEDLLSGSTEATSKRSNANLTVVMFTDGVPAHSQGSGNTFENPDANKAIHQGYLLKQDYDASLFTVGLLNLNSTSNDVKKGIHFLDLLSSNYPNANITNENSAWNVSGNTVTVENISAGAASDKDPAGNYFQLVDENTNLSSIFAEISKQSGGSANESLSAATSTLDIVSSSFMLPANADKTSIKVFTAKCTSADVDNDVYTFATEVQVPNSDDTYNIYNSQGVVVQTKYVDNDIDVALGKDSNGNDKIEVTGFDYSNNWCGPVTLNGTTTYQGHKLIIMIPVKMNPDAVGGPNVETNAPGSGIYVNPDDPEPLITFDSPTVSLPVNIYLEKRGLDPGESAKFRIERAIIPDEENWNPANLTDWSYVSTVFVTNGPSTKTSKNGYPLIQVRGLPATITVDENEDGQPDVGTDGKIIQLPVVYRITEENWAWSYDISGSEDFPNPQYTVTSKVDNPFSFNNGKKENIDVIIRHAESKATNIFKAVGEDEDNERYDDSKTNNRTKSE